MLGGLLRRLGEAACLFCAVATVAAAQQPCTEDDSEVTRCGEESRASPLLREDHWAVRALRQAEAAGVVESLIPHSGPVPRHVVGAALLRVRQSDDGAWARLGHSWHARFVEEFTEPRAAGPETRILDGRLGAGFVLREGDHAPGRGEVDHRTGALPLPDLSSGMVTGVLAWQAGGVLAGTVEPELRSDGRATAEGHLSLQWRGVVLSAGRQHVGYGRSEGGGIVLSDTTALDLLSVSSAAPGVLPGWLGILGRSSFHTLITRLPAARHPGRPVFWAATGAVEPHPRLTVALHRAAMLGGAGAQERVTARDVLLTLIGVHAGVENQIVSGEVRVRLPTERLLPLTAYCEWGAEDSAGALSAVPGVVCGATAPGLPGAPGVVLGAERASFARSCCGNPPWYRHGQFLGSWSGSLAPLGHPLGGNGSEWLGYLRLTSPDARVQADGRVARRNRVGENLFVPGQEGRSVGVDARLRWRLGARTELQMLAAREHGPNWREHHLHIAGNWFLR